MDRKDPKLRQIWYQERIPVVFRQGNSKPLLVHLPPSPDNREWLKADHRKQPKQIQQYKCWGTPNSWFKDIIKDALEKYRSVYVIQTYRTHQKCAPACWNATGIDCECSCMGENHGSGNPIGKWYIVSDTFAVSWGEKQYSCRLIVPNTR